MADTTIKVDTAVRDRLATLAAEHGLTIRDLVEQLAAGTPTQTELDQRRTAAAAYVVTHLRPDFGDEDLAAGEQLWQDITTAQRAGHNSSAA